MHSDSSWKMGWEIEEDMDWENIESGNVLVKAFWVAKE